MMHELPNQEREVQKGDVGQPELPIGRKVEVHALVRREVTGGRIPNNGWKRT